MRWLRRTRDHLLGSSVPERLLLVGVAAGLASLLIYASRGYSTAMLLVWLAALAALSIFLWSRNRALPRIERADLLDPAVLALGLAPLYLVALYRWPVQVSSDEVAVIGVSKTYALAHGVDPFGVSTYLGRPTLLFIGWGNLGELLGGFDLYHMRLLHALVGLLTIAASYVLLRMLLPRWWAIFATCVLGVSHAFLMISRLAMRENTAVLVEVVALALLLWGLRKNHSLATFWGGIFAGLGFYVYFPARATLPLWIAFLVVAAFLFRGSFPLRRLAVLGSVAVAGFVLMAAPIVIAESKVPPTPSAQPQKDTLMIFELGRDKQQEWVRASSFASAYKTNVKWGLTAFNNEVVDQSFIYTNYGHGFVDPLSGILLWLGVGVVAIRLFRRRGDEGSLLALSSFVVLWLAFAFVVNKAPNYTRLLVTLPFVAYFVTEAVRWLVGRWRSVRHAPAALVGVTLIGLVAWNLVIAWDFIQEGRRNGEPIGSSGRYAAELKNVPGERIYVVSSASAPYHVWGDPYATESRMRVFSKYDAQVGSAIDPGNLGAFRVSPPFVLFMRREAWSLVAQELSDAYPDGRIRNVTPDGARVVLEVPPRS